MSIGLVLQSPAPPEAVLASIRRLAGEWRESKIPPELRDDRVVAVEGWVEGTKFRFAYVRRWYWRGEQELHVRGVVRPAPAGGSIVTLHCGTASRLATIVVVAFGVFALWFFRGNFQGWAIFAFVLGSVVVQRRLNGGLSRASNPQADYLVRRVETAVAAAAQLSPLPSHPTP